MWGSDWTKLSVGGVRWYLLTVIDFFSRWIVAWEVVPTVHGGTIKAIYQAGLKSQGLSIQSQTKPELRVDRGSPNTSGITQEFFEALGAELSFARVRRPTDNALTERFYGTIKQEEIYLVGNYPDEISAREEIGRYLERYHHSRPHQSLMNFTPAQVHEVNNKSRLLAELQEMKRRTRKKRKAYWVQNRNPGSSPPAGGCPGKGPGRSVNPGANTEGVSQHQPTDSQIESPPQPKTTHLTNRFCLTEKKLDTVTTVAGTVTSQIDSHVLRVASDLGLFNRVPRPATIIISKWKVVS